MSPWIWIVVPARGVGRPHFTADPDRIYLYLSQGLYAGGGPNGLISVRWDGTDRREHLRVTGPGLYFSRMLKMMPFIWPLLLQNCRYHATLSIWSSQFNKDFLKFPPIFY